MKLSAKNRKSRKHHEVAERIRQLIAHSYVPEDILPPYTELAKRLNVGVRSIKDAMGLLTEQGLVCPTPHKGTVVLREVEREEQELLQIGLVMRSHIHSLFEGNYRSRIISGICRQLDTLSSNLTMYSFSHAGAIEPAEIIDDGMSALLFLEVIDPDYIRRFCQWGVPMVVLDFTSEKVPLEYVACDNAGATRTLLEQLAEMGHKRFAYADSIPLPIGPRGHIGRGEAIDSDALERRDAFCDVICELGLSAHPMPFELGYGTGSQAVERLVDLLQSDNKPPTAIVTNCDADAHRLIGYLRDHHIDVPADVSVAAISGLIPAKGEPSDSGITRCGMDFTSMGELGVDLLFRVGDCDMYEQSHTTRVGYEFVPGETVRAVASRATPRVS